MSEATLSTLLGAMADDLTQIETELTFIGHAIGESNLTGAAGAASLLFNITARIGDTAAMARGAMTKAEAHEEQKAP